MRGEVIQIGGIDIGAILEDQEGNVKKIFQVTEIKFDIC